MTNKQIQDMRKMHSALSEISQYQSPERLRRDSEKDYGLDYTEALEMAYENVIETAKLGKKNVRLPKAE